MADLQKFGFKDSAYERPNDKWVCGRLAEGNPCAIGPDSKGCCRATSVCEPFYEAERWHCRRSELQGGPCEHGPNADGSCCQKFEPCLPKPSLKQKRFRIAMWATIMCIGLIAFLAGSHAVDQFLIPGQMSSSHGSLTDCKTCHAKVETKGMEWLHSVAASAGPEANSKLCIGCHKTRNTPFSPHTNPIERLKKLTEKYETSEPGVGIKHDSWVHRLATTPLFKGKKSDNNTIYCATCHEEHQGQSNDLKQVSNQRCQTCHISQFASFATSHPQFTKFPAKRRTRIIFDHKSHFSKHFPKVRETEPEKSGTPQTCTNCHSLGPKQKYMEVRSYESTCSSCHDGDITGETRASGPKGLDFLTVPGLDVETLNEQKIDIGSWPSDSEAEISALLRALIAIKPEGAAILKGVSHLDLLDLTEASADDMINVRAFAWYVKGLFYRWETERPTISLSHFPGIMRNEPKDRSRFSNLTSLISHDVIQSANQEWFPNLAHDLVQFSKNQPSKSFTALKEIVAKPAPKVDAQPPKTNSEDSSDGMLEGEEENTTEDSILGGSEESSESLEEDSLESSDDSLESEDDSLESNDSNLDKDGLLSEKEKPVDTEETATKTIVDRPPHEVLDLEKWAEFGGWYRQGYSIRYRPIGHADRFLRAWISYSAHSISNSHEEALAPVFDELTKGDAIGRCTKCHSIDDEGNSKHPKWKSFNSGRVKDRFTKFSHEPHLSISGTKECTTCHQLSSSTGSYLKTYQGGDRSVFQPNFSTIDKAICSSCHTEESAGENCTQCHNYHTTPFSGNQGSTKLPE